MATRTPTKGTLESVVLIFDFSTETSLPLASVVSIVVTVESGVAGDPTPAAVLGAPYQISGMQVLQQMLNGVNGIDYRLQCTAVTGDGKTLTRAAVVPVRTSV